MRLFLLIFFTPLFIFASSPKEIHSNSVVIQNYSPKTYKANPQIFSITQADNGIMYFANQLGVLAYDGVSWDLIKTENHVNEVVNGPDGQLFVLCEGDFGVLSPNDKGELQFQSKLGQFKEALPKNKLSSFSKIIFQNKKTYLLINGVLYNYTNDSLEELPDYRSINFIQKVEGKIYIQIEEKGLFLFEEEQIFPISEGNLFQNKSILNITKFNDNKYISTRNSGLFCIKKNGKVNRIEQFNSLSGASIISNRNQ